MTFVKICSVKHHSRRSNYDADETIKFISFLVFAAFAINGHFAHFGCHSMLHFIFDSFCPSGQAIRFLNK